ncbi:UNVERIFIED_CONTAM: Rwdd4 [Trichonephila clavipes]
MFGMSWNDNLRVKTTTSDYSDIAQLWSEPGTMFPAISLRIVAGIQIGTPMTYTLFELAKDNAEELTKLQPECLISPEEETAIEVISAKKEKKTLLTKQQKRRLAERLDAKGERPRGFDWVDVVKHLSQIGSKTDTTS